MQVTDEAPARPLELPDPIACALTRFAEVSRRLLLWRAAGTVFGIGLAAFATVALADRFLQIEDSTRRWGAAFIYIGCVVLAYALLRRAMKRSSPTEVALELERCVPENGLQERISTTVEIAARPGNSQGVSALMIQRVADEAADAVQKLNVELLPDRTPTRKACKAAGAVLAFVLLLCLVPGMQMHLAMARALFPWLNLQRPSETQIEVATGDARVVEGESVTIQAKISSKKLGDAILETRALSGGWQPLRMDQLNSAAPTAGGERESGEFAFKLGPIHERVSYRVRSGDGQSIAYQIDVMHRPEVSGMRVKVEYPQYTGLAAQSFDHVNGDVSVLKGSKVLLSIDSNTPLAAAMLDFADDRKVSMKTEGAGASCQFQVDQDTSYRVRLRSSDGVTNPDAPLFFVRAVPDLPPQVSVLRPQPDEAVDAGAVLPLEVRAEDDLGVVSMRLVVQPEQRSEPVVIPLERPADANKVWLVSQPWDMGGLFLDGSETISYRVEAVDSAGSVNRSDSRRLRVAAGPKYQHSQLVAELERAQQHMGEARKLLENARKDVAEMRNVFRADDPEFQAAERLLLSETLIKVAREARASGAAIHKGRPFAEEGLLDEVLHSLGDGLDQFADTGLRPLMRAAERARSNDAQSIVAGMDVVMTLLPEIEKDLKAGHESLTAAHRYAQATLLELRCTDVKNTLGRITPSLVGSAGWTPKGAIVQGLAAEYFGGFNFNTLQRRTTETTLTVRDRKLDDGAGLSARWMGQMLAPKTGRYVFHSANGVRLTIGGKTIINQWKDAIVDDQSLDFTRGNHWVDSTGGLNNHCLYAAAGDGSAVVTWTFKDISPGRYRVFATWPEHANRATNCPYTVCDGDRALATVHINQEQAPNDFTDAGHNWKDLGGQYAITSNTMVVKLTNHANEYVMADAVRIERVDDLAQRIEAGIELTEGWHDISIAYRQPDPKSDIVLTRSGPDMPRGPLSSMQLRHTGSAVAAMTDGRVRQLMGESASEQEVQHALARLQTSVEIFNSLPQTLGRIAGLPPTPDQQGQTEGVSWTKQALDLTRELDGLKTSSPALALPLLQWNDQVQSWVTGYHVVRQRYRQALAHWSKQILHNQFHASSQLIQLSQDAAAAAKAFNELVQAAQLPKENAQRAQQMAKADATVRALTEDMKAQASQIASELKEAAADSRRPLGERQALQAVAQQAEQLSRGLASELDRRLNEARTPEALAQSNQAIPNMGQQAAEMQNQSLELAKKAQQVEKAVRLHDALKASETALADANKAIKKDASPDNAPQQQQTAEQLRAKMKDLQQAAQAATGAMDNNVVLQAQQLAATPGATKAPEMLDKRAAEALSGKPEDAKTADAQRKAEEAMGKETAAQAQNADKIADSVDKQMAAMAQNWNGADLAQPLREAAQHAHQTGDALAQLPQDKPMSANPAALDKAAKESEAARAKAQASAERLALQAEALRDQAKDVPPPNPADPNSVKAAADQAQMLKDKADDMARLAAAINHEAAAKLEPAASMLDRARNNPSQEMKGPKDGQAQAQQASKNLAKLADLASKVQHGDPNTLKQARADIAAFLKDQEIAPEIEAAIKNADALDKMADQLASADAAANDPAKSPAANNPAAQSDPKAGKQGAEGGEKQPAGQKADAIDAARDALAKALGEENARDKSQHALADRMEKIAADLRREADESRETADLLDQARGMEQAARDRLKKEVPGIQASLQDAAQKAGAIAKSAQNQPVGPAAANAEKSLPQSAQTLGDAAAHAEMTPLNKLAEQVEKSAATLQKPMNEIAAALGNPDEAATKAAQQLGKQMQSAAGKQSDLAEEMRRAARAKHIAEDSADAASGDRAELEEQIRKTIEALDRQGAVPGANQDDLAALRNEVGEGEESGKPAGGEENGEPSEKSKSGDQSGEQAGERSSKSGAAGEKSSGEKSGKKGASGKPSGQKKSGSKSGAKSGGEKSGSQQPGEKGGEGEPSEAEPTDGELAEQAKQARAQSDRLAQMASHMQRLAKGIGEGRKPQRMSLRDSEAQTQTPAADALQAMAEAQAAERTGDDRGAESKRAQAASLLAQAAEAVRSQATGMQSAGAPEAQMLAQAEEGQGEGEAGEKGEGEKSGKSGKGKSGKSGKGETAQGEQGQGKGEKGQGKGQGQGEGSQPNMQQGAAQASKNGVPPPMPKGLPIDSATWNRLPDDLRRDLLNAAGGRFPAEYETSIRRYFKNIAEDKEESR
ncbi:MAG TPA: DUF4175 family protein [Planctomycetota bacterium]|nr:DUF4175 family protein [Planctomycetota bacterium]